MKNELAAAFAASLIAVIAVAAEIPFTVVPMGIGTSVSAETAVRTISDVHRESGITRFVLHAPGHTVRLAGYFDTEGYRATGRRVKAIQDALKADGIQVGFLMGPTLNVGINHPWGEYVRANGQVRSFTACPGDPVFRRDFAARCAACAEECQPFLYMMEDDFRYFFSGCFCERHLERFSTRTKTEWTRETLSAALSKPDATALRSEWNALQCGDLVALAAAAEKAIHAVSPETRIGLSAPGGFREPDTEAIARALAGGRDRPFVRWWGTAYGYDVPLAGAYLLFRALWSKENVSDGIDCVYEADAAPNSAFYGSGARLGSCCSTMMAAGFDGLWYWAASCNEAIHKDDPKPNLAAFKRDSARWTAVQRAARGGHTVGVGVAFNPETALIDVFGVGDAVHPGGSGAAGMTYGIMGIPYTTRQAPVMSYTGYWTFEGMSDKEIEKVLSGKVLLDGAAAEALVKRGFKDLIGVTSEPRKQIDFTGEHVLATGVKIESSFHQNYGLDSSPVSRLALCGAEAMSVYFSEKPENVIQPSVTRFVNAKGGRVVVLATALGGATATNIYNYRKRKLLIDALEWLGGKDVWPIRTAKDVNLVLTVNEDDAKSRLLVHAVNISCDKRETVAFEVSPHYADAAVEVLDGAAWKPVAAKIANGLLTLPANLSIFDTLVVRLVRKVK